MANLTQYRQVPFSKSYIPSRRAFPPAIYFSIPEFLPNKVLIPASRYRKPLISEIVFFGGYAKTYVSASHLSRHHTKQGIGYFIPASRCISEMDNFGGYAKIPTFEIVFFGGCAKTWVLPIL